MKKAKATKATKATRAKATRAKATRAKATKQKQKKRVYAFPKKKSNPHPRRSFFWVEEGNLGSLEPSSSQNTFLVVNKGGLLRGTVGSLEENVFFVTL